MKNDIVEGAQLVGHNVASVGHLSSRQCKVCHDVVCDLRLYAIILVGNRLYAVLT